MDIYDWPYIKKSARRKKRLVKRDFDKKLIQLSKRREQLSDQIQSLPPVVLKEPYQKGWVRLFVLRTDVGRSDKAAFYQALLDKINTSRWHHDRLFKRRKVRKGRYLYFDPKHQKLRELDPYEFHGHRLNLSDAEKQCFYLKEGWDVKLRRWQAKYAFAEPWRFVLVTEPYMVYAARQVDGTLEQELSEVDDYIDRNHFEPRLWKIRGGNHFRRDNTFYDRLRYNNELENKPRFSSKEGYLDY